MDERWYPGKWIEWADPHGLSIYRTGKLIFRYETGDWLISTNDCRAYCVKEEQLREIEVRI